MKPIHIKAINNTNKASVNNIVMWMTVSYFWYQGENFQTQVIDTSQCLVSIYYWHTVWFNIQCMTIIIVQVFLPETSISVLRFDTQIFST